MSIGSTENFDLETLLSRTYPAAYRGPLVSPAELDATMVRSEGDLEFRRDRLRCTRGLIVGLLLEIGMGIVLYGLWQGAWYLLHLHR